MRPREAVQLAQLAVIAGRSIVRIRGYRRTDFALAFDDMRHRRKGDLLETRHGSIFERKEHIRDGAQDLLIVVGGRNSVTNAPTPDSFTYDAFAENAYDRGLNVVTYKIGDRIVVADTQTSEENSEDIAKRIRDDIRKLAKVGGHVTIFATSLGVIPMLMALTEDLGHDVSIICNVPAVNDAEKFPTAPNLFSRIEQLQRVTRALVIYSRRDRIFPIDSIREFIAALKGKIPDVQEFDDPKKRVHQELGVNTLLDPRKVFAFLEQEGASTHRIGRRGRE